MTRISARKLIITYSINKNADIKALFKFLCNTTFKSINSTLICLNDNKISFYFYSEKKIEKSTHNFLMFDGFDLIEVLSFKKNNLLKQKLIELSSEKHTITYVNNALKLEFSNLFKDALDIEIFTNVVDTENEKLSIEIPANNVVSNFLKKSDSKNTVEVIPLTKPVEYYNTVNEIVLNNKKQQVIDKNKESKVLFPDFINSNQNVRVENIDVTSIVNKNFSLPLYDERIKYLFECLKTNISDITSVLNRDDLSLQEKQSELENLSSYFSKKQTTLKYKLDSKSTFLVGLLNKMAYFRFSDSLKGPEIFDCLRVKKLNTYLSHVLPSLDTQSYDILKKNFLNTELPQESIVYSPRVEECCDIILLRFILSLLEFRDQDFGLILIHNVANVFRNVFDTTETKDTLSAQKAAFEDLNSVLAEKTKEEEEDEKIAVEQYLIRRTRIKDIIVNVFFTHFRLTRGLFFADLTAEKESQSKIENFVITKKSAPCLSFLSDFKRDVINYLDYLKYDEAKTKTVIDFLDSLYKDTFLKDFNLTQPSSAFISDYLMVLLSIFNVFKESLRHVTIDGLPRHINYVEFNHSYLLNLFTFTTDIYKLPMILYPNDWALRFNNSVYKKNDLTFGGFLSNRVTLFPAVHAITDTSSFANCEDAVQALNYLQTQPYLINNQMLLLIESNLVFYTKNYIDDDIKKSLFKEDKTLLTEEQFITTFYINKDNSALTQNEAFNQKKNIDLGRIYYRQKLNRFFTFLTLFFKVYCFKNYYIWTPWSLDFRFRMYPQGIITFQGNDFIKSLLDLVSYGKSIALINKTYSDSAISYFEEQKKSAEKDFLKKSSKVFFHHKYLNNIYQSVFFLDVTASGIQILSGLVGYLEGLILTNLITEKNAQEKKKDIYRFFAERLHAKVNLHFLKNYSNKENVLLNRYYAILQRLIIDTLDRALCKNLLMCYVYSEGSRSRRQKIILATVPTNELLILEIQIASKMVSQEFSTNKIISNIAYVIAYNLFVKTCEEMFGSIVELKTMLENITKEKNIRANAGLHMIIADKQSDKKRLEVFYQYFKDETTQYSYWSPQDNKMHSYNLNKSTNVCDTAALRRSVSPNLIHRIDSEILISLVLRCEKENIPIVTAHDCFGVHHCFIDRIKTMYYEEFCELIIGKRIVYNFMRANLLDSELEKFIPIIEKIEKNVQHCKKLIDSNEYVMSSFVLNP